MVVVITFDIDGTLLRSKRPTGNQAHKSAVRDALRSFWNIDGSHNDVPYAGRTDQMIIHDILALHKIPEEEIWSKMPQFIDNTCKIFLENYAPDLDLREDVLPGVVNLLSKLNDIQLKSGNKTDHPKVYVGLVTGNLEPIAWAKMRAAGLGDYFSFGGFGSDALDRADLIRKAVQKVQAMEGIGDLVKTGNVWHVGDADSDVKAAKTVGVKALGVLTGKFTREELHNQGADVVLDDLSDTDDILKTIFEIQWI